MKTRRKTKPSKAAKNKNTEEEEVVESKSGQRTEQQKHERNENSDVELEETEGDNDKLRVDENDDNDEAPDDVSWKVSKEFIVSEMKKQGETLHGRKLREKEARRLKDEWLKQQKMDKVARQRSRLPDDVLQAVAKRQQGQSNSEEEQNQQKHITVDERSNSEDSEQDFHDETDEGQDLNFASKHLGIKIAVLKKEVAQSKKIPLSAREFLQQHLYGDRLHRVPTVDAFSQKNKVKRLGPAMKFVKK